jgi:hypothetical protein
VSFVHIELECISANWFNTAQRPLPPAHLLARVSTMIHLDLSVSPRVFARINGRLINAPDARLDYDAREDVINMPAWLMRQEPDEPPVDQAQLLEIIHDLRPAHLHADNWISVYLHDDFGVPVIVHRPATGSDRPSSIGTENNSVRTRVAGVARITDYGTRVALFQFRARDW